jgi:protein SCO1/2
MHFSRLRHRLQGERELTSRKNISGRARYTLFLGLPILLLTALAVTAHAHLPGSPPSSKAARILTNTKAPDFTLVDQNGSVFQSQSVRGRITVVNFVFTTCPDVCPLFTAKFAQLQRMLIREHMPNFFLISITTDPEVDKPEVLKSYALRYGADFGTWAFLTGEEEKMRRVWQAFGVNVKKKDKGLVQHTSITTLIDGRGTRRMNYYGDAWQEKDLFQDIQTLRNERRPAGAAKK